MSLNNGFAAQGHGVGLPPIPTSMAHLAAARIANSRDHASPPVRRGLDAAPGPRSPVKSDLVIGGKIRELRRTKNLTQKDVAAMVGITGAQLHRYETGTTRVAASRLVAIAESLGVPVATLMGSHSPECHPAEQAEATQSFSASGEGIAELVELFCKISDPKDRRAILMIGRMLAEKGVSTHNGD